MPAAGNVNALPALIGDMIHKPIRLLISCDLQAVRFLFQMPITPEAPFGLVAAQQSGWRRSRQPHLQAPGSRPPAASTDRPGTAGKSGI
jgi:hypothetical protein